MSVINTNLKALDAQASMMNVDRKMKAAMERLSTGMRINSAKDDAAGLAISNRMTAQIRGYSVAIRNANDGISMTQTAEGALGQVGDMLQRMRELSVQASNGAMSSADRQSLQLEVDQLKLEINNIAKTTNHNNIKLLDGSAGEIQLQTGVNGDNKMIVGFDSVQTKDIGLGAKASLSSVGTLFDSTITNTTTPPAYGKSGALQTGDLVLNGVVVGASLTTDDLLSSDVNNAGAKAASAIAKAAAINRVSDYSGVYATVGETMVFGSSMNNTNSGTAGFITLNGVDTASITLGDDLEINRMMTAMAINDISDQTGVQAINTHDDMHGIMLVAKDGRNIELDLTSGGFATSDVGLAAQGTYIGSFELGTRDGSAITISSEIDKNVQNAGLTIGTFAANKASSVSLARSFAAEGAPPSNSTTGVLNGDTLIINGVGINAAISSDDKASNVYADSSTKASSAIAIAAAINKKSDVTGVTAKAEANVLRGTGFTAGTVSELNINGVEIDINLDTNSNRDDVLSAINKYSGQTGVVAQAWGSGIELRAEDGRNISLGSDAADAAALGLDGVTIGSDGTDPAKVVTYFANVKLESDRAFTIDSGSEGNANFALLGFRRGTFGGNDGGMKVADVDISTQSGASQSITAIDKAIESVSTMQARSGAYQNRLEAVVNNLTETNQNMSASRSRILDTDYASETTSLARSQIISQAATAMLAQANQSAQGVLALLQ